MVRISKVGLFRRLAAMYIYVMRGTPLMLQIMFIYYGLPLMLNIQINDFPAAILAFVANYAAYFAEIFRGGIQSISKGQYEGAKVLGFTYKQTMWHIILPQVVKRVIHTTADFDYADNLAFSPDVIEQAKAALCNGATIVTDTNMALSGISKPSLTKLGAKALCLMADPDIAREAKERGVTRAVVSMEHAARLDGPLIFAVGNAPTALIRLHELIGKDEVKPALVIGVPVGFVNVVEAKELFIGGKTPYIIARGRKGGSNVAAAIVNALLYQLIRREGF